MTIAAVFPGQGSQSVGMLSELATSHPVVNETFSEASDVLGYDLGRLIAEGPAETLNQTERTQPALLATGIAVWRVWRSAGGVEPVALAGHSLGEYTALVAGEALGFADALELVRLRGQAMQAAVPAGAGAMAAVLGLEQATLARLCEQAGDGGVVAPANLNAPGQIVIAGERNAVETVARLAQEAGAKRVVPLAVSVPSHCELMRPAAAQLAQALADVEIHSPRIPVLNNADVAAPSDPGAIRDALVRQLTHPVRWVEVVGKLRSGYDAQRVLELGPGRVLSGLMRRIDRGITALPVYDGASLEAALAAMG